MTDLTPLENPKFAIARGAVPIRRVIAIALAVLAIGFLVIVKIGSDREKAALAAANAAAAQKRIQQDSEISSTLLTVYRGESKDAKQLALINRIATAILTKSDAKNVQPTLKFHLLAEPNSINLFALSSGDIYLTTALINRMQTEGQLAAAMAHGAAHAMKANNIAGLQVENGALPQWNYTIVDERAADALALTLMGQAGYDPNAMVGMFSVLIKAYQAGADVAFFTTHPNEKIRLNALINAIKELYPQGVPQELSK